MANQQEIEALYDWIDYFHELRLGKNPDITAAFFDGDFSKTLEQAQNDKHEWILRGIGVDGPGKKNHGYWLRPGANVKIHTE